MKTIAIVPAFNEEARIRETVRGLFSYVDQVVVVDDGSEDETDVQAREAGAVVVRHAVNRGQGAALKTGGQAALASGADIVIHVDGDGQHDPASIPELIRPLREGRCDAVFGSRFLNQEAVGMPTSRRVLLGTARTFNAFVVGVPRRVTDPQCGFRAFTAPALRSIDFRQDRMAHCSEILRLVTRSELRWSEVPVRVYYSVESLHKGQKPWDAARIAWELLVGTFIR